MADPNARPPFRQHPYYYPAIKILVLLVRRLLCGTVSRVSVRRTSAPTATS